MGEVQIQPPLADAIAQMVSGDFDERWEMAKLMQGYGEAAIAPLIELLQSDDTDLCWFVARVLGEFKHPMTMLALADLLHHEEDDLQAVAANCLGNFGTDAIGLVAAQLAIPAQRLRAVQALAVMDSPATIPYLLSVVADPDYSIRAAAVSALQSFTESSLLAVMQAAACDLAPPVRKEAVIGLGLWMVRLQQDAAAVSASAADQVLTKIVTQLSELLRDAQLEIAQQAAIALGRSGSDVAAGVLLDVLREPTTLPALQLECARALGRMETPRSLAYLQLALQLELPVTQEIASLLGRIADPELREAAGRGLIEFVRDRDLSLLSNGLKQAIALSLGQLQQPEARDTLLCLQDDAHVGVRLHANRALELIGR